jgi:hypothetical protein
VRDKVPSSDPMAAPDKRNYWFPAKQHGWGWGPPSSWQGWAVIVIYLSLVLAGIPLIHATLGNAIYLIHVLVLTAILIGVCWLKGEPARWRQRPR